MGEFLVDVFTVHFGGDDVKAFRMFSVRGCFHNVLEGVVFSGVGGAGVVFHGIRDFTFTFLLSWAQAVRHKSAAAARDEDPHPAVPMPGTMSAWSESDIVGCRKVEPCIRLNHLLEIGFSREGR